MLEFLICAGLKDLALQALELYRLGGELTRGPLNGPPR